MPLWRARTRCAAFVRARRSGALVGASPAEAPGRSSTCRPPVRSSSARPARTSAAYLSPRWKVCSTAGRRTAHRRSSSSDIRNDELRSVPRIVGVPHQPPLACGVFATRDGPVCGAPEIVSTTVGASAQLRWEAHLSLAAVAAKRSAAGEIEALSGECRALAMALQAQAKGYGWLAPRRRRRPQRRRQQTHLAR